MDAFGVHRRLIEDYSRYTRSFTDLRDGRVREVVESAIDRGLLWPDPWLQLNPSFQAGATAEQMVAEGLLHPECARIFRSKSSRGDFGTAFAFHRHQDQAIRTARAGRNYVLTTGTGSGKSLAYIVPIVDHVLRARERDPRAGVRAIIVYPMNALANSQFGELEKFIQYGYPPGAEPLRYARYTGQENDAQREAILANPPDIVLTNYVMLELILTRRTERERLVRAARGSLQFLVLDELHTYRGRQGADVAMLIRRVRDACEAPHMQVVGTSATMASGGSTEDHNRTVAEVATRLFGADVLAEDVIGETLARATSDRDETDTAAVQQLAARLHDPSPPANLQDFLADPLSGWIESAFGLHRNDHDELVRRPPRHISGPEGAAVDLADLTGVDQATCETAIQRQLLASYTVTPAGSRPPFAFRLHQFLTKGDTVHTTLEPPASRYLTVEPQTYQPGDRGKPLMPLAFCRECGQDYVTVWRTPDGELKSRDLGERAGAVDDSGEKEQPGFLLIDPDRPWPEGPLSDQRIMQRVPDSWLQEDSGGTRIDRNRRKDVPEAVVVNPDGTIGGDEGAAATWIPAPFRFCLTCGVSYEATIRSDLSKLSGLSSGGRSTATTVLGLSLIDSLRKAEDLAPQARKLLSFTDNRQDAALQAGHFNDFVEVALMRGALYRAAAEAGEEGIPSDSLVQRVFEAMDLPVSEYARDPEVRYEARTDTDRAFRRMLGYRLFLDLQRGWRVTMPNLEQSGLLHIAYNSLPELAATDDDWAGTHAALLTASPATRQRLLTVLADDLRRNLCIRVEFLDPDELEQIRTKAFNRLTDRWGFDPGEILQTAGVALPRPRRKTYDSRANHYLSGRGGFARWLRKPTTLPEWHGDRLTPTDAEQLIVDLLDQLKLAGVAQITSAPAGEDQVPGYQLVASAMRWVAGDGSQAYHDVLRSPDLPEGGARTNPYFVDFYRTVAATLKGLEAREHTAQVQADIRIEREDAFREADLPILFCSPTMELGVDIAQLNAVHLRNVPPTPANYAQRSGRAGRSGQPAIVTTYCAPGSPHDSYFFRRSDAMVAGAVAPPRLELANSDLVRGHVHALWLSESGLSLGRSMQEVLLLDRDGFPLVDEVAQAAADQGILARTLTRGQQLLASIADDLGDAVWYDDTWLERTVKQIPTALDRACDRWRDLYRAAAAQAREQNAVRQDPQATGQQRKRAARLRAEAESQMDLLRNDVTREQSDFYPYRYLAAEGFLPGYSFPRLPLAAFIPGQRRRDEYLQRPRFLAISEFGPGALVYHEGARYQIAKVIIPAGEIGEDGTLPLGKVKQCEACGYLHPYDGIAGDDICDRCGTTLGAPLTNLFRMHNVVTRRRERISSDEEERQRQGYELRTGVRFLPHGDRPGSLQAAAIDPDGTPLLELTYGDAATIWRINLGWRRRAKAERHGYVLDLEDGRWLSESALEESAEGEELPSMRSESRVQRVVPFVEDTRNCLLIEVAGHAERDQLASLSAALKNGIQAAFQLEDAELAAEPLPSPDDRRVILLYEAAEGGAGVLRRLVKEPGALAAAATAALEVMHYSPDGTDQGHAPGATEVCEAACYDCLLSYANQRDHELLDRKAVAPLVLALTASTITATDEPIAPPPPPGLTVTPPTPPVSPAWEPLYRQADSDLERRWLDRLRGMGGRPPTGAQVLIE